MKFVWFGATPPPLQGPDRYPIYDHDPHLTAHKRLGAFLDEALLSPTRQLKPEAMASGAALLAESDDFQAALVTAAIVRWIWNAAGRVGQRRYVPGLRALLARLLRRRLPMTPQGLGRALGLAARQTRSLHKALPTRALIRQAEWCLEAHGQDKALVTAMDALSASLDEERAEERALIRRIDTLLGRAEVVLLEPGEWWAETALAMTSSGDDRDAAAPSPNPAASLLSGCDQARASSWRALLTHAASLSGARPSKRWQTTAREVLAEVKDADFVGAFEEWVWRVGRSAPGAEHRTTLSEWNEGVLRGLTWCAALAGGEPAARALAELAEASFRKIAEVGPRSLKVGNACLEALAQMGDPGLGRLVWLRQRIKYSSALQRIDAALEAEANRRSIELADLEELAVPTCGLDEHGVVTLPIGRATARIALTGPLQVELSWVRADGTPQKSVPAAVRRQHGVAFERVKGFYRELQALLPAQRDRLERLWHSDRCWDLETWRARYLAHPLLRPLARRLIWCFQRGPRRQTGIWWQGHLVDVAGQPIAWLNAQTTVHLWHPLESAESERQQWQRWLIDQSVTQPFRQAHRELYPLSRAERRTGHFSERFTAQVLRQHQLAALCKQRGWRYQFQGPHFGGRAIPLLPLPGWGLRAELQVSPVEHQRAVAQSGVSLYVVAQRLSFRWLDDQPRASTLCPLDQVPASLFSEVIRDLDLFVSVCGEGRDPHWRPGPAPQPPPPPRTPAHHRHDVLRALLPRVPLAPRCRIDVEHMTVRGLEGSFRIALDTGEVRALNSETPLTLEFDRELQLPFALPFEGDRLLEQILRQAWALATGEVTPTGTPEPEADDDRQPAQPIQTSLNFT